MSLIDGLFLFKSRSWSEQCRPNYMPQAISMLQYS